MTSRYFLIDSMGDDQDLSLVFLDKEPDDLLEHGYRLAKGLSMSGLLPDELVFKMQPESPGLKLPSLIGNIMGYLIVSSLFKDILVENEPNLEVFCFELNNHKGKLHSKDYWIINPLNVCSCLNLKESKLSYTEESPKMVVSIGEIVFDRKNLAPCTNIFRLAENPRAYVLSEKLAAMMQQARLTNVFMDEVRVV